VATILLYLILFFIKIKRFNLIFGKIDYINLLPFYIYIKSSIKNTQFKQSLNYKKNFPSYINKEFKKRRIDAAFISSIESKRGNFKRLDIGIVATKEIKSVLVKKGEYLPDPHSATSNLLALKLDIKGQVIIGDKALRAYIKNPDDYVDLAYEWNKRYKEPFVFARLCVNRYEHFYTKLSKNFLKKNIKIPRYILLKYAKSRNISANEIKEYLKLVSYKIDKKSKRGIKRFLG